MKPYTEEAKYAGSPGIVPRWV